MMQTTGDPPWGTCVLLALELFRGNERNNQPLHCLRRRRSTWLLAIVLNSLASATFGGCGICARRTDIIMCDNQGCIALAKNPTHHSRTKHINVQHHFIREKLENQEICLKYCPTEDMIADMLTKPLAKDKHQTLTKAMGLEAFDYSQSGSVEGRALDCSQLIKI